MGRRRAGKKKANQEDGGDTEGGECAPKVAFRLNDEDTDMLPTFATHPSDPVVAMAFGPNLRVYDARYVTAIESCAPSSQCWAAQPPRDYEY
eukprot:1192813-Prorocentrum_minimum.AAC.1